jgi:hypothetical protein
MSVRVVIADHEEVRSTAIERLLRAEYDIETRMCTGWGALADELSQKPKDGEEKIVVLFSPTLPRCKVDYTNQKLDRLFGLLEYSGRACAVIVLLEPGQLEPEYRPDTVVWVRMNRVDVEHGELETLRREVHKHLHTQPLPEVSWDPKDRILGQQLGWLNPSGFPDGERKVLQRMLSRFRPGCRNATVHRMTPGYSGSMVARIEWSDSCGESDTGPVLMKVSQQDDFARMRRLFDKWKEIDAALNGGHLTSNSPKLFVPHSQANESAFFVHSSGFYAEFWQYVSDVCDFEKVYCSDNEPSVDLVISKTIDLLVDVWYCRATWEQERTLWTNADVGRSDAAPPYGLTAWWKAKILSSLFQLDVLGERVCKHTWKNDCKAIRAWLNKGPSRSTAGCVEERVVLSPIHGDLNKSNILWLTDQRLWRPLLIDFATYQSAAHTLLDLATLEVQVVYALMGRESAGGHPALDYSGELLPEWVVWLSESIVAGKAWSTRAAVEGKPAEYLEKAGRLIALVRARARQVFDDAVRRSGNSAPDGRFETEYRYALLFMTLKAIGFEGSLSPFKRLLAIRGAAGIIGSLNEDG